MREPDAIGVVVARLFSNAGLPDRVVVRQSPATELPAGSVWRWDASCSAYVSACGRWVLMAGLVRRGWGVFFGECPEGVACHL